ncbi:MAG: CBS domain-containing protein [Bacillota bacterium]|nr:CBS domain-containing protein [Bacillota bacterium]
MKFLSVYLSRILGKKIYSPDRKEVVAKLIDVAVSMDSQNPRLEVALIKTKDGLKYVDWDNISVSKAHGQYTLTCSKLEEKPLGNLTLLKRYILDKQIIDVNGRKVVRVNDIRLVSLASGFLVVAVDIGLDGIMRRIGIARVFKKLGVKTSAKLMLWNEVAAVYDTKDIKLSKTYNKLSTLHPSDLADIIEDFDTNTGMIIFSSLDNAKAADVLEELEEEAQVNLLKSLSTDKAADILEEMPADEVADILDGLSDYKAEELLNNMEKDASDEVRELLEYEDYEIGSIMTTDFVSYTENYTVQQVLDNLRQLKPEEDLVYSIYVTDASNKLIGTLSLRDIVVSKPTDTLNIIMNKWFVSMKDTDEINDLIKVVSKYNLFTMPITDNEMNLVGNVLITDITHQLVKTRKM